MEQVLLGSGRPGALLGRVRECALLDGLVGDIRRGESRCLVLRGEAGIGKTALLEYLTACAGDIRILRAVGVESEMELAFAGLHQLCAPVLDRLPGLPAPQRQALEVVFGLTDRAAPHRFLVALAVLSLLADVSEEQPVLCVVEDAQWLDQSSALTLAFVARRLLAEPVGLVFAARESGDYLGHLPDLEIHGLRNGDAGALLSSTLRVAVDDRVRDRIVAETRGNPLALLELPHALSAAGLAGFEAAAVSALPTSVEESFSRRIEVLPDETRRLLLIAAAEPLGEPILVWGAAALQGIAAEAAAPAVEAGLCEFGAHVRFRHPLVRAAAYGAGSQDERRRAHAAIAEVTDANEDPDRRAWHRALAAVGPDADVADELERSADRARARGGQAAAAAFLERSADLTLDPARRAERALAAAESRYLAGSGEDALRLAAVAARGPLDEVDRVRIDVLRGRVAIMQRRAADAPPLLLRAAQALENVDRRRARETYRDAFTATVYAGRLCRHVGLHEVAAAIRTAKTAPEPQSATDELLDELLKADALLRGGASQAIGAAVPSARRALEAFRRAAISPDDETHWLFLASHLAQDMWDDEGWDVLSARMIEMVRGAGMFGLLPMALAVRNGFDLFAGNLSAVSLRVAEEERLLDAIGVGRSPASRLVLAAYRGSEDEVAELDEAATQAAVSRGEGLWLDALDWAKAVLFNGLGRYEEALAAARQGAEWAPFVAGFDWTLGELVEAAARAGQPEIAADAIGELGEIARACGTDWILGFEARARALVADPDDAEELYRLAIDHFQRTPFRSELARAHLLYGEWLRRAARRVDAREQLRTAHEMLSAMGMDAFAKRASKELQATGEKPRKRTVETRDDLTAQERQIAELARDGLSNPVIAARLFLSPRTVEWHLRKVFGKLDIRSRHELAAALAGSDSELVHA